LLTGLLALCILGGLRVAPITLIVLSATTRLVAVIGSHSRPLFLHQFQA